MDSTTPHDNLLNGPWSFIGLASSMPMDVTQDDGCPTTTTPGLGKIEERKERRKMYPKEQWLALKDIIKRLYVDEGWTFAKVVEYLNENHGFNPT